MRKTHANEIVYSGAGSIPLTLYISFVTIAKIGRTNFYNYYLMSHNLWHITFGCYNKIVWCILCRGVDIFLMNHLLPVITVWLLRLSTCMLQCWPNTMQNIPLVYASSCCCDCCCCRFSLHIYTNTLIHKHISIHWVGMANTVQHIWPFTVEMKMYHKNNIHTFGLTRCR